MTAATSKLWAVVPAAGVGSRMQTTTPKQYLLLAGKPVLSHSLSRLLALPALQQVVVGAHRRPVAVQLWYEPPPPCLTLRMRPPGRP